MSDKIYKYKDFIIAKNDRGYRVCHVGYSPIFKSLKATKEWIRTGTWV